MYLMCVHVSLHSLCLHNPVVVFFIYPAPHPSQLRLARHALSKARFSCLAREYNPPGHLLDGVSHMWRGKSSKRQEHVWGGIRWLKVYRSISGERPRGLSLISISYAPAPVIKAQAKNAVYYRHDKHLPDAGVRNVENR